MMDIDQRSFIVTCELCGSQTIIEVVNVDEAPIHCPMCGVEAIIEEVEV